MWQRNSPLGNISVARRVIADYKRPVDIHVPALWQRIKSALSHIEGLPGYHGAMLTGSVILRRDQTPKDLDIVLRFDDIQTAILARESLPNYIAGIRTDYFFYIGQADVYFACLDCEARKLYVSRWLPLTIATIETGIEVIERGTNLYGSMVQDLLREREQGLTEKARLGWLGVIQEWKRLTSFVAAAQSRGILATAKHVAGLNNSDGFHCDEKTLQQRQRSCFGHGETPSCPLLVTNARGHRFCGACGCGETQIARLDADKPDQFSKLHYPVLRCPLRKEGFTN